MNEMQKIYCDGAAMAYQDIADQIDGMIERAPEEVKSMMIAMQPLAEAARAKAIEVYNECERYTKRLTTPN